MELSASNESGIVGNGNILTGSSGIHVIGNKNTAGGKNALIFGNNAIVSADNGVAIGESSHSNTQPSQLVIMQYLEML